MTAGPRRAAALVAMLVSLAACGGDRPAPAAVEPPSGSPDTGVDDASSALPVRGLVVKTGDSFSLHECGAPAGRAINVVDAAGVLAKAFGALDAPAAVGIYAEVRGPLSTDLGSLTLTELVRARALGGGLACEPPVFAGDYVANGNEPFWAVEIREDGIVYRSPEEPKGERYPYAITRTETGGSLYATKIAQPKVSTLEISLTPGRCVDSMSGELRAFKAHVVRDGTRLEGCATAGVPPGGFGDSPLDELNRFAGAYPDPAAFWRSPWLGPRLAALLGPKLATFLANIQVRTPVMKDGGVFYVTGNKPHQGGLDNALFLADPASDTIEVILLVNGAREDFKENGRDVAFPAEVTTTLANLPAR
jgi:uncharacterized membrane protein